MLLRFVQVLGNVHEREPEAIQRVLVKLGVQANSQVIPKTAIDYYNILMFRSWFF